MKDEFKDVLKEYKGKHSKSILMLMAKRAAILLRCHTLKEMQQDGDKLIYTDTDSIKTVSNQE